MLPILDKYGDLAYQVSSTQYPPNLNVFCQKNGLVEYLEDFELLISQYHLKKEEMDLVDFNDLMTQFYLKLKENKLVNLESIDYIFFDEYQDVNPIQNQILEEFVKRGINLMVVGDPRQSIYSFRGSQVEFINNFQNQFPNSSKFILPYNYRSCFEIVNLCNHIFPQKIEMKTKNPSFRKPKVHIFADWKLEKKFVIDSIVEKKAQGQLYQNMTILARKNRV